MNGQGLKLYVKNNTQIGNYMLFCVLLGSYVPVKKEQILQSENINEDKFFKIEMGGKTLLIKEVPEFGKESF